MIVTGMQLASARKIEQVRDYSVCEIPSRIGYCGCGVWLVIPEVRMAGLRNVLGRKWSPWWLLRGLSCFRGLPAECQALGQTPLCLAC